MQPWGTLVPLLFDGHITGIQDPLKKGATVVPVTVPTKPALHIHPLVPKLKFPLELAGHATIWQEAL